MCRIKFQLFCYSDSSRNVETKRRPSQEISIIDVGDNIAVCCGHVYRPGTEKYTSAALHTGIAIEIVLVSACFWYTASVIGALFFM